MKLIFEWDENKAKANLQNHKISFEEAKTIFNDPFSITFPDDLHSQTEERFISIGASISIAFCLSFTRKWNRPQTRF